MTLPYSKKMLDHAKEHQVPLLKVDIDWRHVKAAPIGLVSRTTVVSDETAQKILSLIEDDMAAVGGAA